VSGPAAFPEIPIFSLLPIVFRAISYFKTIGTFVGKALLDSRIIDCNFNKVFMKAVLGQHYDLTVDTLSVSDAAFALFHANAAEFGWTLLARRRSTGQIPPQAARIR
jgi:E3 ubiquitin-protein ligase TRIP12